MATRTGAEYTHFEAAYCDDTDTGSVSACGMLIPQSNWDTADDGEFPPGPDTLCPNCGHWPLSHVSVTTADRISGT